MRIGLLLSMGMLVASGVQAQELGAIPGESFNATPVKVWRDPFAVGVARQESDVCSHCARLAWDNIRGSAFSGSVTRRDVKVDGEASGELS